MRLWILFGCGVLILGAAVWPFGKRTEQLAPVPVPPTIAVKPATPEVPKPEPAKVIEVIDLARAYEPIREPEEPAGVVDPATLIDVPEQPKPIPPAGELIDVMPREVVALGNGLLEYVPTSRLIFTPMGVPNLNDAGQQIPPEVAIQNGLLNFTPIPPAPMELLDVLPREIPEDPYRGLLDEIRNTSSGPGWSSNTPARNSNGITADWPAWDVAIDPIWLPQQWTSNYIPALHGSSGIFYVYEGLPEQLIAVRGLGDLLRQRVEVERACTTHLKVMPREVK